MLFVLMNGGTEVVVEANALNLGPALQLACDLYNHLIAKEIKLTLKKSCCVISELQTLLTAHLPLTG